MKVLFLSNRVPFPPNDGGTVGVYQALMGLVDLGIDVTFFSLNPSRNKVDLKNALELEKIPHKEIYNIQTDITPWGALKNLLQNKSYHISRFYNKNIADKLAALLQKNRYDIIHFDGLQITIYLDIVRRYSQAKCVMRAANVEHKIWEGLAEHSANIFKKWYLKTAAQQLKKYELETIKHLDGLITVSIEDAAYFKQSGFDKEIHIAYTGFDITKLPPHTKVENCIYHIGAMDWMPNIEGLRWFMKEVWPLVHQKKSKLVLHLAGKNMEQEFYQYNNLNVNNHGQVQDALEFVSDKSTLIVPLFSGSGMRVKTVEAMAMGKTIIGTKMAAQGLPEEVKEYMIIVKTAKEFAEKIIYYANHTHEAHTLGQEAKLYAATHFEVKQIAESVVKYYNTVDSR
ncbi:MAG: glycosyltransferase family 4 protein [Bacteroidota bacterium]|nr:glycosyltransferase family 4 protein [Bacteroidota bacterium]